MKKKTAFLTALAVILVLAASIDSAWAYFTTYAEAKGGHTLSLGDKTKVEEDFSAWTKHVSIQSDPDSEPVYIRVKAFCGSEYKLVFSDKSGKWSPGSDGYYYYSDIVNGGEATKELQVKIENVPKDVTDADSFNVVVIYESTPVLYKEDGTPYADWKNKVNTGTVKGGAVNE